MNTPLAYLEKIINIFQKILTHQYSILSDVCAVNSSYLHTSEHIEENLQPSAIYMLPQLQFLKIEKNKNIVKTNVVNNKQSVCG